MIFYPQTSNEIWYFDSKHVHFPKVCLGDGYIHNTSHDKILHFLSNLKKFLTWHRKTLKGWGQQVPNKTKSLYFCILESETCLRAGEICVAGHTSAAGVSTRTQTKVTKLGHVAQASDVAKVLWLVTCH